MDYSDWKRHLHRERREELMTSHAPSEILSAGIKCQHQWYVPKIKFRRFFPLRFMFNEIRGTLVTFDGEFNRLINFLHSTRGQDGHG